MRDSENSAPEASEPPGKILEVLLVCLKLGGFRLQFRQHVPLSVFPAKSQEFGFVDGSGTIVLRVQPIHVTYCSDGTVQMRVAFLRDPRSRDEVVAILEALPGIGPVTDAPRD